MRFKTTSSLSLITAVILFFATNAGVRAETYGYSGSFYFSTNGSEVTIRNCWQWQGDVIVPETLEGLPVTRVADYAFGWELSSITIPNTVTFIEDNAFSNCSPATTVNVPNSVTHVGISAFTRMSNLVESQFGGFAYLATTHEAAIKSYSGAGGNVTIPETIGGNPVVYVFSSAFQNSTNLTGITLPNGITTIGSSAFQCCTNLTSITMPDGVTTIGNSAFQCCTNLTSITMPDGVITIGSSAFEDCTSLASIIIPTGVTTIQNLTFRNCTSLKSVSLPAAITSLGNQAFMYCRILDSITIPYGVTSIGDNAFMSCALTSVTIPDSVTFIGNGAFALCASLRSATLLNTLTAIPNYMFIQCSSLTVIAIPDSVHTIGDSAFEGTQISSISGANVSRIGVAAFYGCRALETASFSSGGIFFDIYAFDYCESLKSINIPVGSIIREGVFYGCRSLTSVIIPEGVPAIERSTFQDCSSLTNITIPDSVTSIGDYAFYGCTNLTVHAQAIYPPSAMDAIFADCKEAWYYYKENNNGYLGGSQSVTITGGWSGGGPSALHLTIPDSINGLPVVKIGDGSNGAFQGRTQLQSVYIPSTVTALGTYTFQGCTNLTVYTRAIYPPSAMDAIFGGCKEAWFYFIENNTVIVTGGWSEGGPSAQHLAIPDSINGLPVVKIGDGSNGAFQGRTQLQSVYIPSTISTIGAYSFQGCANLSVTLSDSITTVRENAFDGCLSVVSSSNGRSPLELWRQTFFADREDVGSGANLATPMGDGVPNLVKYALCLNPTQTGVTPNPRVSEGKLSLKFQRDPSRNDISIKVEATNDLASSWTTIARSLSGQNFTGNATILETDAGEGIKNMEIRDTEVIDSQNKKRFLRISISQ